MPGHKLALCMLRVHSDHCVILSPTNQRLKLVMGDEDMSSWREREREKLKKNENKEATECCESALVIRVYLWGFWFVFSSVLICSAESSMLKFGLFSAAPGERQILSDCTLQTQSNI